MSELKVNTISKRATNITIIVSSDSCKQRSTFSHPTNTILFSLNTSSITDVGTGRCTFNFSTNFADANYGMAGFCKGGGSNNPNNVSIDNPLSKTASAVSIETENHISSQADNPNLEINCWGDLV